MALATVGRTSVWAWDIPANQEEPWRRFLQELSGPRYEEYAESRRRLGVSAESVWLAPKRAGGGVAVVCLEAEDPQRTLHELASELAASEAPFDLWYRAQMSGLFGCDFARSPRIPDGELLFAWRKASDEDEQEHPED